MRRFLVYPLATAMLALAPGLANAQAPHNDPYVQGPQGEARMIHEIRHELVMLPYYSIFDDLGFRVEGSTVTLVGAVTRPVLKSDAGNVVKRVEGVSQVNNEIKVLPPSEFDAQIRRAMFRTIYGDPQIGDRYGNRALPSIHIIVDNGHVTLEGVVANKFDKDLINVRANSVPNVFSVTNNLQIEKG